MTHDGASNRRIRVLMVMPSYYPVVGGMEIQVEGLIPYLREHGIDATILTRRSSGMAHAEMRDGIEIRRIAVRGGPGLRSLVFTSLGIADIGRRRSEIDILHAHSVMSPTTIAATAGVLLRKPCLVTVHQSYETAHLLSKPFGETRLRIFRRSVDRFVSISADIERLLRHHGVPAARIASIPNGIDTRRFTPACGEERAELRAKLGLSQSDTIVVFVGRLQAVKQVDTLLRAWAGVSEGRLVILGDGDERGALTELARELQIGDRVIFRGMVANVDAYLRASDIFVLPSASEGLSVALLEGMSSGLVPIATAIGGTVDLIEDGRTGLLVEPGDVDGLRGALDHALRSPDWRVEAAQRARERVVAGYDVRVIAARLASLYRDAIAEHGSAPDPQPSDR